MLWYEFFCVLFIDCYIRQNIALGTNHAAKKKNLFSSEGLDKIEFLQAHSIREIYQKAFTIIETYFNNEEEEDGQIAPTSNNNQYQFNPDPTVPMGGYQFNF